MHILLSTSPHVRHPAVLGQDFENTGAVMYGFAPVGLLSLAGSLRREIGSSVDVAIFDINAVIDDPSVRRSPDFYAILAARLLQTAPDLVGFMTECDSYHHVLNICREIRTQCPATFVVLGGPHASAVADETMRRAPYIDAIVKGEGEHSFAALVKQRLTKTKRPIAGAVQRYGSAWFDGGAAILVDELDDLPALAYDLYTPGQLEEVFLEVGRGCPFACTFCSTAPYWGRKHRVKSPTRILDEIASVREHYGATRIHFTHDLFTVDRRWVVKLCEALKHAGGPVSWTCSARTDTVDRRLLETMRTAGCSAIYFGLESGSQAMLKTLRKSIPISESLNIIGFCSEIGITPNAGFITGFPNETVDDLKATFEMYEQVSRLGCKPAHIFAYCPFKGSDGYPADDALEANTHFLDIPLHNRVDECNRLAVSQNAALFGGYFRARQHGWRQEGSGYLEGIDEFTPLIESMKAPALYIAPRVGGLYGLYGLWIPWVARRNEERAVAAHRKFYGNPALFAEFLLSLAEEAEMEPSLIEFLAFVRQAWIQTKCPATAEISMATFRSFRSQPALSVSLQTPVSAKHILGVFTSAYDLACYLDWEPHASPPFPVASLRTYVWAREDDGGVKLLSMAGACPPVVGSLQSNELSVAEIWLRSLDSKQELWADCDSCQSWIENALLTGLLIRGENNNANAV